MKLKQLLIAGLLATTAISQSHVQASDDGLEEFNIFRKKTGLSQAKKAEQFDKAVVKLGNGKVSELDSQYSLEDEIGTLQEELNTIKTQKEEADDALKLALGDFQNLQKLFKGKEAELKTAQDELEAQNNNFTALEKKVEGYNAKITELETQKTDIEAQLARAEEELKKANASKGELDEETKEKITKLTQERDDLKVFSETANNEIERLEKELEDSKKALVKTGEDFNKEKGDLENQINNLKTEIDGLKTNLKTAEEAFEKAAKNSEDQKARADALENQLKTARNELKAAEEKFTEADKFAGFSANIAVPLAVKIEKEIDTFAQGMGESENATKYSKALVMTAILNNPNAFFDVFIPEMLGQYLNSDKGLDFFSDLLTSTQAGLAEKGEGDYTNLENLSGVLGLNSGNGYNPVKSLAELKSASAGTKKETAETGAAADGADKKKKKKAAKNPSIVLEKKSSKKEETEEERNRRIENERLQREEEEARLKREEEERLAKEKADREEEKLKKKRAEAKKRTDDEAVKAEKLRSDKILQLKDDANIAYQAIVNDSKLSLNLDALKTKLKVADEDVHNAKVEKIVNKFIEDMASREVVDHTDLLGCVADYLILTQGLDNAEFPADFFPVNEIKKEKEEEDSEEDGEDSENEDRNSSKKMTWDSIKLIAKSDIYEAASMAFASYPDEMKKIIGSADFEKMILDSNPKKLTGMSNGVRLKNLTRTLHSAISLALNDQNYKNLLDLMVTEEVNPNVLFENF